MSKNKKRKNMTLSACMTIMATTMITSLTACNSDSNDNTNTSPSDEKVFQLVQGTDKNSKANLLLSLNPAGPGGAPNQSMRAGDILIGHNSDDILIGGLGVDVLLGLEGDDIIIGGTEDFNSNVDGDNKNSDNRDRAFGNKGNDAFIWSPGDGNDFFDGGEGIDVVILGVLGEAKDAKGKTEGAPFFIVSPPSAEGSQDFDGIYLDKNNHPTVRLSESPGFCSVVDALENEATYAKLNIDHIVQFTLRDIANQFDEGNQLDDDGLRVSLSLKNTEYVICTKRDLDNINAINNIVVLDISGTTPITASLTDLPEHIQAIIQ